MPRLYLVCGPSGAGKSSVIAGVDSLAAPTRTVVRRTTTRVPRPEDTRYLEYEFVSLELFLEDLARGEFVDHTEHEGALYGVRHRYLKAALSSKSPSLLMCGTSAAIRIWEAHPDQSRVVFVYPESERCLRESGLQIDGPAANELRRRLMDRHRSGGQSEVSNSWIEARVMRGLSRTALILKLLNTGAQLKILENRRGALGNARADLAEFVSTPWR